MSAKCEKTCRFADGCQQHRIGERRLFNDYGARTTWGVFGVFDVFHADNAKVLQALLKNKKRHEILRYHASSAFLHL